MFFLSKFLSALTQPIFWLALWWALSLLIMKHRRVSAVVMLWLGLLILGLLGFQAIPDALLRPLENRYPTPNEEDIERHTGIIVLGGAFQHPDSYTFHGQVPLGEAAERMTVPIALIRQHPHLQLVFSGGEGRLLATGVTESALARTFFNQQGLPVSKLRLEAGSRTTRENAQRVAALLGEDCNKPWLLVTSAWHMPRSMAEFETVGCSVTAYPVDFRTGERTPLSEYSLANSLLRWQTGLHEWFGLLVYSLTR